MSTNYTEIINNFIGTIPDEEPEITTVLDALKKLISDEAYNRTFSDRFSELVSKKGNLPYAPHADERQDYNSLYQNYLLSLYREHILPHESDTITEQNKIIDSVRKNIRNWLSADHRPNLTKSRDLLYKICFALQLSFDETEWFFNHLCSQRSFNLYSRNEFVYLYCINNSLTFEKAISLIKKLEEIELPNNCDNTLYTWHLSHKLENEIHTDDNFIEFYKSHYDFISSEVQNRCAKEQYREVYQKLKPTNEDEKVREIIKSFINKEQREINILISECSPFILEQFEKLGYPKGDHRIHITEAEFSDDKNLYQDIHDLYCFFDNQDIHTDAFLLRCMYGSRDINIKNSNGYGLPYEKILSDLNKDNLNYITQYHNLRACLILFNFFDYWLNPPEENKCSASLYKNFIDDLDDILMSCGYERLFSGNTYDRIFIVCSKSEDPISTFRAFVEQYLEKL